MRLLQFAVRRLRLLPLLAVPGLAAIVHDARAETIPEPPQVQVDYMSAVMAKSLFDAGGAIFIDVRGRTAFAAEHIPGSMRVELPDLRAGRLPPLPREMPLVIYCGCPHSLSDEAARYLRAGGFQSVFVLDEGYYGWKELGYPVTIGPEASSLRRMQIHGRAPALPAGTRIYARHADSDQWEAARIDGDGRFEMHLPFYNVPDGAAVEVRVADRQAVVRFEADAERQLLLEVGQAGQPAEGAQGR